ncbi:MAG: AAA domain-containing protein [Candidatus Omnitrophica bacterium]|nr:AAA domain-containing protein [Candidatus Omnitrophota bacterium]
MENYIKEMLWALKANIEYLKEKGNLHLKVKNGKLVNNIGDIYIYEFTLDFFQDIEPNNSIEVKIKGQQKGVNGRVITINDKNIQVEVDKNIGITIPEAQIIVSSYYLLELLYEKLKKVDDREIKLTDLVEKTFNPKPTNFTLQEYQIPYSFTSNLLNQSQEKAIKLAMGSEVSFIWGPPGTGKTKTIAHLIEGFLSKNLSVLLISHTNIATDNALLSVVKHFENTEDYLDGKFLREGLIQKPELKAYEMVIPKIVLEKKGLPIKNEINMLTKRIEEIYSETSKSKTIIKKFQKIKELKKKEENIKVDISKKEKETASSKMLLSYIKNQLSDNKAKIEKCQSKGILMRFFFGLNLEKLIHQKSLLLIQKDKEERKIVLYIKTIKIAKVKLHEIVNERKKLELELKGENLEQHKNLVKKNDNELKNLEEQRNLLIKKLDELSDDIIKEAKVIATTLTKSYSSKIVLSREYDCLIVDEASMAPLPALWFAAGIARKKVVIVGDFYQLSPIIKHKVLRRNEKSEQEIRKEEILVERWLKKNIFEVAGIFSAISSGVKPQWLEQLKVQYRMHPDIAGVVNTLVYGRSGKIFELDCAENTINFGKDLLSKSPLKNAHVGIYNTSKNGSLAVQTNNGSYYNLYQGLLAVLLANQAVESGYKSIGIISPFRQQTNLIKKIAADENLSKSVEIDTVHRFQGGEKQIIIFDTTTAEPTKLTNDEKLLNVAFSRAKEKCIVIADVQTIDKKHSLKSLLRKFIYYCREKNFPIISSVDIFPTFLVSEKTERWLRQINNIDNVKKEVENSRLFNQRDFYKNFIGDLLKSKQEVIIISPFITSERVRMLIPIFEHLIKNKGIKIFILTRPPKDHNDYKMEYQAKVEIKKFENMGIIVLPFSKIHQKLAIIDRNILWEGSLNILSYRDTHEEMRRFEGKETSQQMMAFLNLDKNIGNIGENKLKRCDFCHESGAWYWTDKIIYGGLFTFCLACGHKLDREIKNKEEIKQKAKKKMISEGTPICPKHDLEMVKRKGRWGEFWGCPKYPVCNFTKKIT